MREYKKNSNDCLKILCNKCGKELKTSKGMITDAALSIDYEWGYFSDYDGETHSFDICQDCYKEMVKGFIIPIDKKNTTELM